MPKTRNKSTARKLREVCEVISKADSVLIVKYVSLLLWLYINDQGSSGVGLADFREKAGANSAVQLTRFCKYFSGDSRKQGQQVDIAWVSVSLNPQSRREKIVKLTAEGRRKVEHLLEILES